jgi:antitoxin YefM
VRVLASLPAFLNLQDLGKLFGLDYNTMIDYNYIYWHHVFIWTTSATKCLKKLSFFTRKTGPKIMFNSLKQTTTVGPGGKIELCSAELLEGTPVEVIILIMPTETGLETTDYLWSTEANRQHLLEAIGNVEKRQNLITITPEEWHGKYCV